MTSREIADLTGMLHKNLMRDIRNMEDAWERIRGLKFELSVEIRKLPQGGVREYPYYILNKTECLYIATKFNDEARAKLIVRWEELEIQKRQVMDFNNPETVLKLAQNWAAEAKKNKVLEARVQVMQPVVDYVERIEDISKTFSMSEAAKTLKLPFGRNTLLTKLREQGILMKGRVEPYQKYVEMNYFEVVHGTSGQYAFISTRVTHKGLKFLSDLFPNRRNTNIVKY